MKPHNWTEGKLQGWFLNLLNPWNYSDLLCDWFQSICKGTWIFSMIQKQNSKMLNGTPKFPKLKKKKLKRKHMLIKAMLMLFSSSRSGAQRGCASRIDFWLSLLLRSSWMAAEKALWVLPDIVGTWLLQYNNAPYLTLLFGAKKHCSEPTLTLHTSQPMQHFLIIDLKNYLRGCHFIACIMRAF